MSLAPNPRRSFRGVGLRSGVSADGSCLYHAVVRAIHKDIAPLNEGLRLRADLAQYVIDHETELASEMGRSVVAETLKRVASNEWGENEEIAILSRMLRLCIVVHSQVYGAKVSYIYDRGQQYSGADEDGMAARDRSERVLQLVNDDGLHYDALL